MSGGGIRPGLQGQNMLGQPTNVMGNIQGGSQIPIPGYGASGIMTGGMGSPLQGSPLQSMHPLMQYPTSGPAPPIQNPPTGGIAGNPGYSQGMQPQLSGGYWNQLSQMLAGPQYQAKPPITSQSLPGYQPYGQLGAYSNFPGPQQP